MRRGTATIGTLLGIPVRIHWSWLLMLVLLIGMLSPIYSVYSSGGSAWLIALLVTLLLFVSVVLHELGHALVARSYDVPVHGITLFAMGGVIEIAQVRSTAMQQLLIAIAGPGVNMLLSVVSSLIWLYNQQNLVGLLSMHFAIINVGMALFNLLPGYPLDGGRVLRGVVWFLSDEELLAARVTALFSRACGWVMIFTSIFYAGATGDIFSGLWIAIAGYFLVYTAVIGYRQAILQSILNDVSVADLMQRAYHAVTPELPLDQFVGRYVLGQVDQGFPVLRRPDDDDPQPLMGMMTLRDLRRFRLSDWTQVRVGEAMTPLHRLHTLTPNMPAGEALHTLIETGEEQLPVVGDNTLLGILRRSDLVRFIQRRTSARR